MKNLFVLVMLFSFVLAFSMPEKAVMVNVSDDICLSQDQDVNITQECKKIAKLDFKLINEAEVEISPGLNQEVYAMSLQNCVLSNIEVKTRHTIMLVVFNTSKFTKTYFNINTFFTLNHKLYEISPGDILS